MYDVRTLKLLIIYVGATELIEINVKVSRYKQSTAM